MNTNLPMLAAFVGAIALVAAATWWLLSDEAVWPGEVPTTSGKPVQRLLAVLPVIGDFDREFNVNDDNPFLPMKVRQRESALRKIKRLQPNSKEPTRPVVVTEVAIPTLQLPAAAARRKNAPECFGVIGSNRGMMVLARMPGSKDTRQLEVGQSIAETENANRIWIFIGMDSPNMARFRDPSGEEQIFRVGSALTAKNAEATAGIPAKSPVAPKQPTLNHQALPPSAPQQASPNAPRLPPNGANLPPGGWRTPPGGTPGTPGTEGARPRNWSPRSPDRPVDESGQPVQAPPPQPAP
ncbi:MAG: hypothetical protein H0V44_16100 [Planctomycetes bacterium]|nr:hypothetical protein [Planctomycetota bacterium]